MFRLRLVSLGRIDIATENVKDPTGLTTAVAAFFTGIASRNFTTRMEGDGTWEPRMNPNVPGIISDLRKVSTPKGRRFDDFPTPFDTGLLSRSTVGTVVGKNKAVIGVTGPAQEYADVQHSGGDSESEEITQDVSDRLTNWLDSTAGKPYREDLGWLASQTWVGKTLTIRVRARPWLNFDQSDFDDMLELLPEAVFTEGGVFA